MGDCLSCHSHFDLIIFVLLLHRNGCFGDEVSRVLGGGLVPGKLVFYTAFHVRLIVFPYTSVYPLYIFMYVLDNTLVIWWYRLFGFNWW